MELPKTAKDAQDLIAALEAEIRKLRAKSVISDEDLLAFKWPDNSKFSRELRKWEQPGYDPKQHPYPRMMYQAFKVNGRVVCMATTPSRFGFADDDSWKRACDQAEEFTRQCQIIVQDEEDETRHHADGWREGPAEAVAHVNYLEDMIAKAAAERHASDRRFGEKAREEAAEVDASTPDHVPEVTGQNLEEARDQTRQDRGARRRAIVT